MAWTNLEDFIVEQEKTSEVNALLSCDGEEFARQLVEEDRAVTLEEVNKALKEAQLPAVKTNRMNKVSNEEKMLDLWVFGSWKRGGLGGVTRVTKARPWLTKVLTNFMRQKTDEPFMAITVSQDVIFKPHKDPNDCTFATTLIGMTTYEGGELWIEQPETQSENSKAVWRTVKEGEPPRPGKLHPTANGRVVQFFGNQLHGTEDYRGGTRRVMIGYIPRGWRRLQADDMNVLRSLGFRIPGSSLRPTSEPQQQADLQSQAQISITQLNHNHTPKPELLSPIAIGGLEEEKGFGCEGHEEFWEDVCRVQDETRMGHGDSERDLLGWDIQGCNERVQTREVSDLTAEQAMAFLAEPEIAPEFADSFEQDRYGKALKDLELKCHQGLYDKECPDCKLSRGALRPHKRLDPATTSKAVLSLDLTGPHIASMEGFRYALIGVYTLNSGEALLYSVGLKTKTAEETAAATIQIIARLYSLGAPELVRIHTDGGGEFAGAKFEDMSSKVGVWRTVSAPYHPQANGRAERAVQKIKAGAISLLLHSKFPVKYWFMAMREYTFKQRQMVLFGKIPVDAPSMGDNVMYKPQQVDGMRPRGEQGRFICNDDRCPGGALVLVTRNGREAVLRTYSPRFLDIPRKKWKIHLNPETDEKVWVSSAGDIKWEPPPEGDILTMEERNEGPELADEPRLTAFGDLGSLTSALNFTDYGHAYVARAETTSANKSPAGSGYKVWSRETEREAYKVEARALTDATGCDDESAEHVCIDTRVFSDGPEWKRKKWLAGLEDELVTMFEDKQALVRMSTATLRQTLGLSPSEPLPKTLPSKLVLTAKPDGMPGPDGKVPPVNLNDENTYRSKVRLVACGNYDYDIKRGDPKFRSSNVPPEAIRAIISLIAQNPKWVCAPMDIVTAFLNAELDDSEVILLRPPPILRRLSKAAEDEIWLVKRAVYGLRAAPKAWERARDQRLNYAVLKAEEGHELGDLKLIPWDITAGLWRIVQVDHPDKVAGVLAMYVDDGLLAGEPEVVQRVGALILSTWNTKLQAVLANATLNMNAGDSFQMANKTTKVTQQATFLGIQIVRLSDNSLFLTQEAWIKNELKSRGWETFNGCKSLPCLNEGHIVPQARDEMYHKQLRDCQSQVGALLWVSLRTRPDLSAAVGVLASHMSCNPDETLKSLKAMWRHLRYTQDFGIRYAAGDAGKAITTSSDASWAPGGSKSRSGTTVIWGSHLLAWRSQKQTLTAYSPAEAELDALGTSLQIGCKMQHLIQSITGYEIEHNMQGDNIASIQQLLEPGYFAEDQRTRHFALRCSYIRDHLEASGARLNHCPGTELAADGLTKILPAARLAKARDMLGVHENTAE